MTALACVADIASDKPPKVVWNYRCINRRIDTPEPMTTMVLLTTGYPRLQTVDGGKSWNQSCSEVIDFDIQGVDQFQNCSHDCLRRL